MRELLHLAGVHTNACRGDLRCWSFERPAKHVYANGWWRR